MKNLLRLCFTAITILACCAQSLFAQSTAFTYQGQLDVNGSPANGVYDLLFQVFDAASAGNSISSSVNANGAVVSNGLFTVALDFGSAPFTGSARWLEIAVSTNGAGNYSTLAPRQPFTATPYSVYANTAGTVTNGAITASRLAANSVAAVNIQNATITGAKIASGQVVKSLNGLTDAVSLTQGANVTLTTNGNSLQISAPAGGLTLPYNGSSPGSPAFTVNNSSSGTAISGLSSGAGSRGVFGSGDYGIYGEADAPAGWGVFGVAYSGAPNSIGVNGQAPNGAGVGVYGTGGDYGVRGHAPNNGGRGILGTSAAMDSVAIRGLHQASGNEGQLGRHDSGVLGAHSTGNVGRLGTASEGVYGEGYIGVHARAGYGRALFGESSGGQGFDGGSGEPQLDLLQNDLRYPCSIRMGVVGNVGELQPPWYISVGPNYQSQLTFNNVYQRMSIDYVGNVRATSFNPTSDRNAKKNFHEVNPGEVLAKVAGLPISRWNFKEDDSVQHIGPMAQDFYAAFGLGLDDKHIATVDADGVALAAIQGLHQKLEQKETEITELKERLDRLESLISERKVGAK